VGVDYDPVNERAELKKLRRKHRQEMRGAMRELRRDSAFVQQQRADNRKKLITERDQKTKQIMASLADQQGEIRKMEIMRKKMKQHSSSVL